MKVYVITSGEYSDYCIRTVALSGEKAEQICAMLNSQKRYYSDAATIGGIGNNAEVCRGTRNGDRAEESRTERRWMV